MGSAGPPGPREVQASLEPSGMQVPRTPGPDPWQAVFEPSTVDWRSTETDVDYRQRVKLIKVLREQFLSWVYT